MFRHTNSEIHSNILRFFGCCHVYVSCLEHIQRHTPSLTFNDDKDDIWLVIWYFLVKRLLTYPYVHISHTNCFSQTCHLHFCWYWSKHLSFNAKRVDKKMFLYCNESYLMWLWATCSIQYDFLVPKTLKAVRNCYIIINFNHWAAFDAFHNLCLNKPFYLLSYDQ